MANNHACILNPYLTVRPPKRRLGREANELKHADGPSKYRSIQTCCSSGTEANQRPGSIIFLELPKYLEDISTEEFPPRTNPLPSHVTVDHALASG